MTLSVLLFVLHAMRKNNRTLDDRIFSDYALHKEASLYYVSKYRPVNELTNLFTFGSLNRDFFKIYFWLDDPHLTYKLFCILPV